MSETVTTKSVLDLFVGCEVLLEPSGTEANLKTESTNDWYTVGGNEFLADHVEFINWEDGSVLISLKDPQCTN